MIKYEDLKIGSQIILKTPFVEEKIHAVCISENDKTLDFLAEFGNLPLTKNEFDELVINFEVELIDKTHPQWQNIDNKLFNFFNKLNDLEKKQMNREQEGNDDYLYLLEALGDEFDENI